MKVNVTYQSDVLKHMFRRKSPKHYRFSAAPIKIMIFFTKRKKNPKIHAEV